MLREMKRRLESAFTDDQVAILAEVLDEQRTGLATSVDMQDLKDAVKSCWRLPKRAPKNVWSAWKWRLKS